MGASHVSSPSSSPLSNILTDRGPLGGELVVHTAPWDRSKSLHVKLCVCIITTVSYDFKLVPNAQVEKINILWLCMVTDEDHLAELHGGDVLVSLLIPYDKGEIIRVAAALIDLDRYVLVRVAARNSERKIEIKEGTSVSIFFYYMHAVQQVACLLILPSIFDPDHTEGEQGCGFVCGLSHLSEGSPAQDEVSVITRALVGYNYGYPFV